MKKFKLFIYWVVGLVSFLIPSYVINAATLSVNMTQSANQMVVGNTITYTVKVSSSTALGALNYSFTYDDSKLTLVSGTLNGAPVFTGSEKQVTYTFKFRAKASGTAKVNFILNDAIDWNYNSYSYNRTTTKSVSIITQAQLEASYSKNNYLSSLSVSGFNILPVFNKDTSTYSLELENDVRAITINGTLEDSRSSVTGLGNHDLVEGLNKIDLIVTAQNGSSRTYTINVTVKELSPIVVEIDNESYNVVRKKDLLTKPNSNYEEAIIKINDLDVPAFVNNITDVTLVGLKDKDGNISLYTYNDGEYKQYKEFSFDSIIVTEDESNNVPSGYTKKEITINEKSITAYQDDNNPNYYLLTAVNISTGKANLYQYDSKENTIQIFNNNLLNENNNLESKNKIYIIFIIGLAFLLLLTYVLILINYLRNNKKKEKKKENKKKFEDFDKEIENFDKNNDKIKEDISEDKKTTKKSNKKK